MRRKLPHHSDMVPTEITVGSVALVLFDLAAELCPEKLQADSLCEWTVDESGQVFCEGEFATKDPRVALLVNAGNLLQSGKLAKPRRRKG